MNLWDYAGEAVIASCLAFIIFGGGMFAYTLIRFTVQDMLKRARRRRYAKRTMDNCVHYWIEHYN